MAGPFSSQGGVQDIPEVQLRGGFAPDPGVAGAIKGALDVALPAIRDNHVKNLKEDVTAQSQSIREALEATRNPAIAQSLFREEALANPITAQAFKEFNLIQDAASQGKLPQQFALERLEVIQNNAISNAPEFEREIRSAMLQATGQDPSKALFSKLLSGQAQSLSPEQKGLNNLRREATQNGLTVDQQQEVNHSVAVATLAQNKLNRKKAQGTYDLLDVASETNGRAGGIMLDVMNQLNQETRRSGGVSPEFKSQLKAQTGQAVAAAIAQITATTAGIDGSQVTNAVAPLVALQGQLDGMIEDQSLQTLVTSKNTVNKAILEDQILSMPDFASAWTFGGQRGFLDMMKFLEKAPDAPSQAVLASLSPSAQAAFTLRNISANTLAKQYGSIGTPVPQDTPGKNARFVAGSIAAFTTGIDESVQATAVGDMRLVDEELTWTAFGSRKGVTATTQSKTLQAAFINMQTAQTSGLSIEFLELSNSPSIDVERFQFAEGKLSYQFRTDDLGGVNSEAVAEANAFTSRFNRANDTSASHMRAGTLPSTRYTNTADYWDVVTKSARDVIDGRKPAPVDTAPVVRWTRDENGNPIQLK